MADDCDSGEESYPDDYQGESSDDGDFEIHGTEEISFDEKLKAARKTLKQKKTFVTDSDVEDFFTDFNEIAGISSRDSGTLLHALVDVVKESDGEIKEEDFEPLVRRLVEEHPSLLKCLNKEDHTPVYMAITYCHDRLINCMLDVCLSYGGGSSIKPGALKLFDEALRARGGRERQTSLHRAIGAKLEHDTIRKLVENASDEALSDQDATGKTPMHHAVQYKGLTPDRVELIDVFLQRDLRAFPDKDSGRQSMSETFLDIADDNGRSVYQELRVTREASKTKKPTPHASQESSRKRPQMTEAAKIQAVVLAQPVNKHGYKHSDGPLVSRTESMTREVPVAAHEYQRERFADREELRKQKKASEADRRKDQSGTGTPRHEHRVDHDIPRDAGYKALQIVLNSKQSSVHPNVMARSVESLPNTSIKRTNTLKSNVIAIAETQPRRQSQSNRGISKKTDLRHYSEKILMRLKLHYMRTRSAERAISFIHGTNMEDIQIIFDYDLLPSRIKWKDFQDCFGKDAETQLKFDEVLQNVTFPYVEVEQTGRNSKTQKQNEERSGVRELGTLGRNDMKYFFDWLYNKGVRHIIKVSVQEATKVGEKVHSDRAIQESLERFVVEELDWQKPDLDPETILHVSSKVTDKSTPATKNPKAIEFHAHQPLEKLYLRWSGSNAVLRAWSEPEGLAKLPQLREVYLYKPPVDKMSEDTPWVDQKIQDFTVRLNRNFSEAQSFGPDSTDGDSSRKTRSTRKVKVIVTELGAENEHRTDAHNAPVMANSNQGKGVNSHKWLDSTERFAEAMQSFWKSTFEDFMQSRKNQGTLEGTEGDVVVALIDDGINKFETNHPAQFLEGKSFDFHGHIMKPPYSSAGGHGTLMANMILRVCPMAKIYPIRLRTYKTPSGKNQIDRDYAAQAVKAALDKKATIISMSWTLPMTHGANTEKDKLHQILQKAVSSKVLMFCSAPDAGKFEEIDYPSGPWRNQMFRIGAAGADGRVFAYTPEQGITYVLPGVDVVKDRAYSSRFRTAPVSESTMTNFEYETGSSVATALAAGLAAMVIYCVKASIMVTMTANGGTLPLGVALTEDGATLIAEYEAMKQAFNSLGTVTSNNFIQIWEELDKVSEMLEHARGGSETPETKTSPTQRFIDFGTMLAKLAKRD